MAALKPRRTRSTVTPPRAFRRNKSAQDIGVLETRRAKRQQFLRKRGIYLLPNAFTTAALFCALESMSCSTFRPLPVAAQPRPRLCPRPTEPPLPPPCAVFHLPEPLRLLRPRDAGQELRTSRSCNPFSMRESGSMARTRTSLWSTLNLANRVT